MKRLPRATYSLMVSLLPATATVIGIVVLTQIPSARQVAGVALVIAAVAIHRDRDRAGERDGERDRERDRTAASAAPRPRACTAADARGDSALRFG
jgi:inner membrane transporter RhtA